MSGYHFPIKSNFENTLYFFRVRVLKLVPMSMFLVLLALVVGFSMATGYLMHSRDARAAEGVPVLAASLLPVSSGGGIATPGKKAAPRFAISLGAYVVKHDFGPEKRLSARFGQPFHVVVTDKKVTMTRVLLGTYPREEATAVLARMKKISPDAFLVEQAQGRTASVYAGSYFYWSYAENQKKLFAQRGHKAVEVPTRLTVPLYSACMGDFDSRAHATEFLRTAGLSGTEMPVVRIN